MDKQFLVMNKESSTETSISSSETSPTNAEDKTGIDVHGMILQNMGYKPPTKTRTKRQSMEIMPMQSTTRAYANNEFKPELSPEPQNKVKQKIHHLVCSQNGHEVIKGICAQGFDLNDTIDGIKNMNKRLEWEIGSHCSIFSRRKKIWFDAQITDIIADRDTKQNWLMVKYNGNNTKRLQRYNKNIKPIHHTFKGDHKIIAILSKTWRNKTEKLMDFITSPYVHSLSVNDKVDHRNEGGKFVGAVILEKNGSILKLQYEDDDEFVIDSDIKKDIGKYAEYGSISKRAAHRFSDLNDEDYIDINLGYYGDYNWRYGEIVDMDDESGQVQVGYMTADNEYNDIWIHLDNVTEIAECSTKADTAQMIKQHIYDPFFNIKKNENNVKLMRAKSRELFVHISEIAEQKSQKQLCSDALSEEITYLNDIYWNLYTESIKKEMKGRIKDADMELLDNDFMSEYMPIVKKLRKRIDSFHVKLNDSNDYAEDDLPSPTKQSPKMRRETRKMRAKWQMFNSTIANTFNENVKCKPTECICIKRVNYILEIFEKYIKTDDLLFEDDEDSDEYEEESDDIDFMYLYNKCIEPFYKMSTLLDDFHHIQSHHMKQILHSKRHLIKHCEKHKKANKHNDGCPFSEEYDRSNGLFSNYTEPKEISLIQQMVKMHIHFRHKEVNKVESCLGRINNNKFVTIAPLASDKSARLLNIESPLEEQFVSQLHLKGLSMRNLTDTKQPQRRPKEKPTAIPKFEFGEDFHYSSHRAHSKYYIDNKKYENLKEEILQNKIYRLDSTAFDDKLVDAMNHSHCEIARKLKSKWYGLDNEVYEVPAGLRITISHLLCVILYTNHTELQYNFKKYGCRVNEKYLTMEELKPMNAEIGWWYTLFHETILFFGDEFEPSKDKFYHGISCKLLFDGFNPIFKTPLSTTVSKQVAEQFADNGIVLELKPFSGADGRYFNVEWISCFPQEKERIMCSMYHLYMRDLRYVDAKQGKKFTNSNRAHLLAMRLFDFVFKKNCCYDSNMFHENVQLMLINFLQQKNFENYDSIKKFNEENDLHYLNDLFDDEEYDTEAIEFDLDEEDVDSIIVSRFEKKDQDKLAMYRGAGENPAYLQQLFNFMVDKVREKEKIFVIKSEYERLDADLRNVLDPFIANNNVDYVQEFEWKIEGDDFREFMALNPQSINQTEYTGPGFECKVIGHESNKEETIMIRPSIHRIHSSFPQFCAIGFNVVSIPSGHAVDFRWSSSVKEVHYSPGREYSALNMDEDDYKLRRAFKNKKLKKVNSLTLTLYVRPHHHSADADT